MNLAHGVRSLWLGARGILGGPQKTTVVICPSAQLPAQAGLDTLQRMDSCSRWPELEGCRQACMLQIRYSAEELHDFVARYEGKQCTSCGALMTGDDWYRNRLAALEAETARPNRLGYPSLSFRDASAPICSTCYGAKVGIG